MTWSCCCPGSFPPCLTPIARFTGADALLCTEPEITGGRVHGSHAAPMVGAGKVTAARAFAAEHHLALADCFGYGDDASDLGVLTAVGFPLVVGNNEVLRRHATEHGWPCIPPCIRRAARPTRGRPA